MVFVIRSDIVIYVSICMVAISVMIIILYFEGLLGDTVQHVPVILDEKKSNNLSKSTNERETANVDVDVVLTDPKEVTLFEGQLLSMLNAPFQCVLSSPNDGNYLVAVGTYSLVVFFLKEDEEYKVLTNTYDLPKGYQFSKFVSTSRYGISVIATNGVDSIVVFYIDKFLSKQKSLHLKGSGSYIAFKDDGKIMAVVSNKIYTINTEFMQYVVRDDIVNSVYIKDEVVVIISDKELLLEFDSVRQTITPPYGHTFGTCMVYNNGMLYVASDFTPNVLTYSLSKDTNMFEYISCTKTKYIPTWIKYHNNCIIAGYNVDTFEYCTIFDIDLIEFLDVLKFRKDMLISDTAGVYGCVCTTKNMIVSSHKILVYK
jgi:hypothetical protein